MTHLDHLKRFVPSIATADVLDLGSGKGAFLIQLASEGIRAKGLEYSAAYIATAREDAAKAGVAIDVVHGRAEQLPFPDASFDFVNISEVLEHVEDPYALLLEVGRVLRPTGCAYLSVPNRFGLKDQHFHLYFVNWLPRSWSDAFIALCGRHKDYADRSAGHQRLSEMHYYTYPAIRSLIRRAGLTAADMREERIQREFRGPKQALALLAYPAARAVILDSFHLLLRKAPSEGMARIDRKA